MIRESLSDDSTAQNDYNVIEMELDNDSSIEVIALALNDESSLDDSMENYRQLLTPHQKIIQIINELIVSISKRRLTNDNLPNEKIKKLQLLRNFLKIDLDDISKLGIKLALLIGLCLIERHSKLSKLKHRSIFASPPLSCKEAMILIKENELSFALANTVSFTREEIDSIGSLSDIKDIIESKQYQFIPGI